MHVSLRLLASFGGRISFVYFHKGGKGRVREREEGRAAYRTTNSETCSWGSIKKDRNGMEAGRGGGTSSYGVQGNTVALKIKRVTIKKLVRLGVGYAEFSGPAAWLVWEQMGLSYVVIWTA